MFAELLVNAKSFIIKLILLFLSKFSKLNTVIIVKTVDIVHHTSLVSLDGSENQEVL